MLVVDGITRMRFRNGFTISDTASMIPGTVYPVEIVLPTTSITFKAGHKIRVDITSSNYPRFDANLNNGGAMYVAGDTNIANNTVYFNSQYPSHIDLNLVDFVGSVQPLIAQISADVFPNPANGAATLHFNAEQQDVYVVEIIDLAGRVIWTKSEKCSGEQNWSLPASLSPGTYIVRLAGADGKTFSRRFVKTN
jgi:hypothetical protein